MQFRIILSFIAAIIIPACKNNERGRRLNQKYISYWGETYWEYKFKKNGKFIWKAEGHYGNVKERGTYEIIEDTLYLFYTNNKLKKEGVLNHKYLIQGDSCILDLTEDMNYKFWTEDYIETITNPPTAAE
ncbi:MAG TPA: hypothetical protein ENJ95_18885 [Bacteroidetes bacterium]|nr:hypothetical protein [Bacteroidota bacterium]